MKYGENIALSIFKDFNFHNHYDIYKKGIIICNNEINKLEKLCNITPSCSNGCSYCCQQIIYIHNIEKEIIKKRLNQLSTDKQEQIRNKNNKIMNIIQKNNVPYKLDINSNILDSINRKYLALNLPCPLLNDNNSCEIYEVRPTTCWVYKNYGHKEDCNGKIAEHSYPFLEYAFLLFGPFMSVDILKNKSCHTEIELLPKVIYEILK